MGGDGGEDHQVAVPDHPLRAVVHDHAAADTEPLQMIAEPRGAVGGRVVHADPVERPAGAGQVGVDVTGDEPGADESDPGRAAPGAGERVGGQYRGRGGAGGTDDRALQHGERVAGRAVVEDQHRRRPGDAGSHVAGEARDPLQPVHMDLTAERCRQRDDPRRRAVREAQEVRRRVDRLPGGMPPVGGLDQRHDLGLAAGQRPLHLAAGDHRERRHGERRRGAGGGGARRGGHRGLPSPGTAPARRTGSAMPTSTFRGPV